MIVLKYENPIINIISTIIHELCPINLFVKKMLMPFDQVKSQFFTFVCIVFEANKTKTIYIFFP